MNHIRLELTHFGVRSLFEIAEDIGLDNVGETYLGILISLYRKSNCEQQNDLNFLYPKVAKEVTKYI